MRTVMLVAAALLVSAPSWALYKVVGPDGKVTYTDKPPAANASAKVSPITPGAAPAAQDTVPFELRQPMQRFPVVLYTSADCVPCDSARQLLIQRGVPFNEKRLSSEADARAYDQLGGGRTVPGLGIGAQQLRGLNTAEWTQYLDAAGYPKESRLPKDWKPPVATPLVESRPVAAEPAREATGAAAAPVRRPPPPPAQPASGGIRF